MTKTENPSQNQIDQAARLVADYWNATGTTTLAEITADMWADQANAVQTRIAIRARKYAEMMTR